MFESKDIVSIRSGASFVRICQTDGQSVVGNYGSRAKLTLLTALMIAYGSFFVEVMVDSKILSPYNSRNGGEEEAR